MDAGRATARLGFFAGATASIVANLQSVALPERPAGSALAEWHALPAPEVTAGARGWAIVFPVFALIAVALIERSHTVPRWLRFGVAGFVAVVALVSSYVHLVMVLLWNGQNGFVAWFGPFAIDGLMVLCSVILMERPADIQPVATDTRIHVDTQRTDIRPVSSVQPVSVDMDIRPEPRRVRATVQRPAVPVAVDSVPAQRVVRGGWDVALAEKLIREATAAGKARTAAECRIIGEQAGTSYKTIERLWKAAQSA